MYKNSYKSRTASVGDHQRNQSMFARQTENRLNLPPARGPMFLAPRQREHLAAVVAELVPDWVVELRYDVTGQAIIVILPENPDGAIGPTLIVRVDEPTFHLEERRRNADRILGEYRTWDEVLRAIRIRIIWEMPYPTPLTDQRC